MRRALVRSTAVVAAVCAIRAASCPGRNATELPLYSQPTAFKMLPSRTMSERRTETRFEASLDAVWDGTSSRFRVADLSEGGCYIDTICEAAIGEVLFFKVQLPNSDWLELSGEVAHCTRGMGFGLRFVNLETHQREKLLWLIAYLSEPRGRLRTRLSA